MRKPSVQPTGNIMLATKLQGWIDTLPEFWQPIATGAGAIVAFMAMRGAAFLLPIGVIYVLVTSSTPLLDLGRGAGLLLITILAGALSGLMYSLVGRHLRRFGAVGYSLSGVITMAPYMVVLVHLGLNSRTPTLLHRADNWDYGFAAIASILVGSAFGHAFYKRDRRKAALAEAAI